MFILKAEWEGVERAAIRWANHSPKARQQIPGWSHPEQQALTRATKWQPVSTLGFGLSESKNLSPMPILAAFTACIPHLHLPQVS